MGQRARPRRQSTWKRFHFEAQVSTLAVMSQAVTVELRERRPAHVVHLSNEESHRGDEWWRSSVIYQIYPRSFRDANGDGDGDLEGITAELASIRELGVDAIWLSPFYPSPQQDGGYDVSDFRDVDPVFGSLDDFDALIARADELRLRVIVDLVPNHCSSEHGLFRAALAAGEGYGSDDRGNLTFFASYYTRESIGQGDRDVTRDAGVVYYDYDSASGDIYYFVPDHLTPISAYNEDYNVFQTGKEEGLMRAVRNGLYGAVQFAGACMGEGVQPITATLQCPSSNGCNTAPSASTDSRNGVHGNAW